MLIDLGEVREAPAPAAGRRPPDLRRWRWVAAVGAAFAVLSAGGSEPVRADLVEVVVPVAGDHAFSGPDGVYFVDGNTIMKYEPPATRPRWRLTLADDGLAQGAFVVGETVVITGEGLESQTTGVHSATGEVRWRRPGIPAHIGDDHLVLTHQRFGYLSLRREAVDLATGSVRWALTDPDGEPAFFGEDRFVRWSSPDRVEVRDLATGRVLATGAVPRPSWALSDGGVQMLGDLVLVGRERGGRAIVDAYDLDRLARRWSADIDLGSEQVSDCGDAVCVARAGGAGVRVIEAGTGRLRWSDDRAGGLERIGPVLLWVGYSERPARIQVLDPVDGHLRADLGRWEIGWPFEEGGRVLAIRPGADGGAWIAELDLIRGRVRTLGATRDAFDCRIDWGFAVCGGQGEGTGIWYPRRR